MRKIELTESQLTRVISESVRNIISENMESQYTHFAVNKSTGLIVNGWDYSDIPGDELRSDAKYYFYEDLKDSGFNPKMYKIWSLKNCIKNGIDVNNESKYWSNTGVWPFETEKEMQEKGLKCGDIAYERHPDWFV